MGLAGVEEIDELEDDDEDGESDDDTDDGFATAAAAAATGSVAGAAAAAAAGDLERRFWVRIARARGGGEDSLSLLVVDAATASSGKAAIGAADSHGSSI